MNIRDWRAVALLLTLGSAAAHADDATLATESTESARAAAALATDEGHFIAVPIPISNPSIGTGLEAALLYLHPKPDDDPDAPTPTSGLGGMYTDSRSWFLGAFHDGNLRHDRYRYRLIGGYGKFNLDYYGSGGDSYFGDHPLDYQFTAGLFDAQVQMRLPSTRHWYAGVQYGYLHAVLDFEQPPAEQPLPDLSGTIVTSAPGLIATYDTRDDNYYPTRGLYFQGTYSLSDEAFGSDFNFNRGRLDLRDYLPLWPDFVLAMRGELQTSGGDVPFFALPYLNMRGFALGRYRDDATLSFSGEGRYRFAPRWVAVGFLETGWYGDSPSQMQDHGNVFSYGAGLRWRVTKAQTLNLGVDIAFSDDDYATYIRVGEQF